MSVKLNEVIINKLESISCDIKVYVNMNYGSNGLTMEDSEIDELIEIRNRIKTLAHNMRKRIK